MSVPYSICSFKVLISESSSQRCVSLRQGRAKDQVKHANSQQMQHTVTRSHTYTFNRNVSQKMFCLHSSLLSSTNCYRGKYTVWYMIHNVSDSLYYMVLKVNILFGKCHVGMKSFLTSFVHTSINTCRKTCKNHACNAISSFMCEKFHSPS